VNNRPPCNPPRSRRAAKRYRHRRNRLARQLLDQAYHNYLSELAPRINPLDISVSVPSPPPPPPLSPQQNQIPSPPRSPIPPVIEPDSPHSAITTRIFPDSPPPSIRSFSPPSYSPISSPEPSRPISPANSTTSSVEFIDEVPIPPPQPRHYYYYDPHEAIDNLIRQFPQHFTPLPPGSYSIGPDDLDLSEIRSVISGQNPDTIIPVFLPLSPFPYQVPVRFFYIIRELS